MCFPIALYFCHVLCNLCLFAEEAEVEEEKQAHKEEARAPMFQSSNALSFADLASTSGWGFGGQKADGFQFANTGQKLFSAGRAENGDEEDNPEKEADIHFKPVVSLPEVTTTKSWDADADAVFSHRSKLYRFDCDSKQWKERGIGDLKIMKHRKTGRVKLIMRREQTLKLCCNHDLTADMSLQQLQDNDKSYVWFTPSDFSEQTVKAEKLVAKFKHAETASKFKEAFDRCKAELS